MSAERTAIFTSSRDSREIFFIGDVSKTYCSYLVRSTLVRIFQFLGMLESPVKNVSIMIEYLLRRIKRIVDSEEYFCPLM